VEAAVLEHIKLFVVTEVTIYGGQRCVAGWDLERECMVRPEPAPGQFWDAIFCGGKSTFHPGYLVSFDAVKPETDLPHQTEDWVVKGSSLDRHGFAGSDVFRGVCLKSLSYGPEQAFGTHLHLANDKAFVSLGSKCGSLCALELPKTALSLFESVDMNGERKIRARLPVMGHPLNLSVAAKDLKQAYRKDGLTGAIALLDGAESFHVRLGLARAMPGNDRCYLQINGIYPVA
jgi:hypothetical protein